MKITVEYDTETKKISVKEGGTELTDVEGVSFYKDCYCSDDETDKYNMSLTQRGKKEGGMTKTVYSVAKILGWQDEN